MVHSQKNVAWFEAFALGLGQVLLGAARKW